MVVGRDSKAHQVSVEAGIRQDDRIQITTGLSWGEKVITSGAYGLPNETKVKIAEASAAESDKGGLAKPDSEKGAADDKKATEKEKQ